MNKIIFLIPLIFAALCSCSPKIVQNSIEFENQLLPKDKELLKILDSLSAIKCNSLYTKINVDYKDQNRSLSFKISLSHISDSVIYGIVTFARFPVFSALIESDSILLINRTDKCYSKGNLTIFEDLFGVNLNFENLEELIYGRPIDFKNDQKYYVVKIPFHYEITSHREKVRRKLERKLKEEIILTYILNNSATHISSTRISSISDSTEIEINYLSHQKINDFDVPEKVLINISNPLNSIEINLKYDKVEINEPQEIILKIPETYEECF